MPVILQHGLPRSPRSIEERLAGPVFDDLVVIVPTRRRIRHLVREVLRLTGNPVTPSFPFYTLESFATSLYQRTSAPARLIGGPLQTLLFEAAVRTQRDRLSYFQMRGAQTRLPAGTFEKIMGVILHLKESGVSTAQMRTEAADAPLDEQRKLLDIALIAEEYDAELIRHGAIDAPGLMGFFSTCPLDQFVPLFRHLLPSVDQCTLAGFDEFTGPELDLLQLLTAVPDLAVTLLFDFEPGNPALFGHLESNYRRFRSMGYVPVRAAPPRRRLFPVNTMSRSAGAERAAGNFARHLFQAARPADRIDAGGSITLIGAANRRQEVRTICRLIKHLTGKDPALDLGTVCVAMLRPQLYTDLFREECRRYGIPANVTDRYELSRSPVVVHVIQLLTVALSRYRRDDVLRVAVSPFFTFGPDRRRLGAAALGEVSGALRIVGGASQWRGKIDRAEEALRGEGLSGGGRGARRAMQEARSDFELLAGALAGIDTPMPPRMFAVRLVRLLDALHLRENLLQTAEDDHDGLTEVLVRSYGKFLDALEEMVGLLEFQEGPEEPHTLRSYVEHLTVAVLRERYNVRERFGSGVLITSIDETRGLSMGTMIVAGLVDGEFPAPYQTEVFLSARRLKERELRSRWQNRYLFYQAISNWTEHLYLTYPRREGECELVPSSFLDSLLQVADIERWDGADGPPFADALLCEEDVLAWAVRGGEELSAVVPATLQPALKEVRHAVDVERRRMVRDAMPLYAGILTGALSEGGQARLSRTADGPLSVTQLETYGRCPFQFFAERLLEIGVPPDLEEELTARERGSLVHDALFEFYREWRAGGRPRLAGCSEEVFAEASSLLTRILEEKLEELDIPDPFWQLDAELLTGAVGGRQSFVQEFFRAEQKREEESIPEWFEVSFGGRTGKNADERLSQEDPVALGSLRLRGKVDRVERGEGFFAIVDYKTGEVRPSLEDIRRGISLQLPLYLLVVQEILSRHLGSEMRPAAGLYYQLRSPVRIVPGFGLALYRGRAFSRAARSRQIIQDAEEFTQVLHDAVATAEEFARGIRAGRFPLTAPENIDEICTVCDFRSACRIQTARHVAPVPGEVP
jgi:ATP-dependent helicase/nuclease subunit B